MQGDDTGMQYVPPYTSDMIGFGGPSAFKVDPTLNFNEKLGTQNKMFE
jgi:hypothetical protein